MKNLIMILLLGFLYLGNISAQSIFNVPVDKKENTIRYLLKNDFVYKDYIFEGMYEGRYVAVIPSDNFKAEIIFEAWMDLVKAKMLFNDIYYKLEKDPGFREISFKDTYNVEFIRSSDGCKITLRLIRSVTGKNTVDLVISRYQ